MKKILFLILIQVFLTEFVKSQNLSLLTGPTDVNNNSTHVYTLQSNNPSYYVEYNSVKFVSSSGITANGGQSSGSSMYVNFVNNQPQGSSGNITLEANLLRVAGNTFYMKQTININISVAPSFTYLSITGSNLVDYLKYGTHDDSFQHYGKVEYGVFKAVYEMTFTKQNNGIPNSDIIFEYSVLDNSQSFTGQKQFIIQQYGLNSPNNKIAVLGNDLLESYESIIQVRARQVSTNKVISPYYEFLVYGVNH
jgi:hypothetical protein